MKRTLAAFLLLTTPAAAQQVCAPTGKIERTLMTQSGETIVGVGLVSGGVLFTMANPATGSFTVLLRGPNGQTCILISGKGWETIDGMGEGLPL